MNQYFPKLYKPFRGDLNVKVDLKNDVVKKTEYKLSDKLIAKVNNIDTTG